MLKKAIIPEGMDQNSPMNGLFSNYNAFLDRCDNRIKVNEELLMGILKYGAESEFGKEHDFANIKTVEKFKEKVPITTYDDYYEAVDRMTHGKKYSYHQTGNILCFIFRKSWNS